MAATTMQKISQTFKSIVADFGEYTFVLSDDFKWSASDKKVYYSLLKTENDIWSLLHEIAHGQLKHSDYNLDIELIGYEAAAWDHAKNVLAPLYNLTIDEDFIEDHLDTYRNWLQKRSTCPDCGQNGLQTQNTYNCINCRCLWRTNEARLCALRRIRLEATL